MLVVFLMEWILDGGVTGAINDIGLNCWEISTWESSSHSPYFEYVEISRVGRKIKESISTYIFSDSKGFRNKNI